jgi:hypothetical protein
MHAMRPSSTGHAEGADRWAFTAGCAFLEGTATGSWGIVGVRGWFQDHLVSGEHMCTPISVSEPLVGTFTLHPRSVRALHPQASLPALLSVARNTVLATLRGFIDKPSDDRFVAAALFSGRVRRAHGPGGGASRWIPQPDPDGPLSTLVLSLFVVDMLTHREAYDRSLCVCDVCGRVSFREGVPRRLACPVHGTRPSSIVRRVTAP